MVIAAVLFGLLLLGHALADSILQPPWLSQRKRDVDLNVRLTALLIHGICHALPVALVTGSSTLAVVELFLHPTIDHYKNRGWYGLKVDQALHVLCKVGYIAIIVYA
jgi:hypothetical protein